MKMKKTYIIAFFFFMIDFFSKQMVSNAMKIGESIPIIRNFFYLTYTHNTGAAWSILEDERIPLLILTVIVLVIVHKYLGSEKLNRIEQISYGMLIGGILGNFLDRLIYGYVIDFWDFYFWGYNYPIFNMADCFIVVGIILIIIVYIRKEKNNERSSS